MDTAFQEASVSMIPRSLSMPVVLDRVSVPVIPPEGRLVEISSAFGLSATKRVLDIVYSSILLLGALPVLAIVAIAVKIDSRGPVFFSQERVGLNGRRFWMLKIRSMLVNSEELGPKFADVDDHRVTRLGKFIRKYRLDELPQLFNVLKGEMSLIGPRPEQVAFVEAFKEELKGYRVRHFVRPGITGLAQVNYGYCSSAEETRRKLRYDLCYVRNSSLKMDLVIILQTIKTVLSGFGAR